MIELLLQMGAGALMAIGAYATGRWHANYLAHRYDGEPRAQLVTEVCSALGDPTIEWEVSNSRYKTYDPGAKRLSTGDYLNRDIRMYLWNVDNDDIRLQHPAEVDFTASERRKIRRAMAVCNSNLVKQSLGLMAKPEDVQKELSN